MRPILLILVVLSAGAFIFALVAPRLFPVPWYAQIALALFAIAISIYQVRLSDTVLVNEEWQGVVRDIVDTQQKTRIWALDEYGLMVDQRFLPERFLREYAVDLISRVVV